MVSLVFLISDGRLHVIINCPPACRQTGCQLLIFDRFFSPQ